jgi:hypothetical protein
MSQVRDYRDGPDLPSHLTLGELRVLHHYVERMVGGPIDEGAEISILVRDRGQKGGAMMASWVEFSIAGRSFGIWRSTLALYEADEHGAMGEDEVQL